MQIERTSGLTISSMLGPDPFIHLKAHGASDWAVQIIRPSDGSGRASYETTILGDAGADALRDLLAKAREG